MQSVSCSSFTPPLLLSFSPDLLLALLFYVNCTDGETCSDGETCCEQESGHSCCAYPNVKHMKLNASLIPFI
uniref:Granulins domain-containing protein n=1 Tax=Pygocentrus nattereri TaxID=42514 RepID=A0A3B4D1B5_PYGNA